MYSFRCIETLGVQDGVKAKEMIEKCGQAAGAIIAPLGVDVWKVTTDIHNRRLGGEPCWKNERDENEEKR